MLRRAVEVLRPQRLMRGLLAAMMGQAAKVERFKHAAKKEFLQLVRGSPFRYVDAGELANARFVERMTLFAAELGQREGFFRTQRKKHSAYECGSTTCETRPRTAEADEAGWQLSTVDSLG